MIQDISPKAFDITFKNRQPDKDSVILCFSGQTILIKADDKELDFPRCEAFSAGARLLAGDTVDFTYLFRIDDTEFFLFRGDCAPDIPGFAYENTGIFRKALVPKSLRFAGITAYHIYKWYKANKFCGVCGGILQHSEQERMLHCGNCGNSIYPKISPAVIVAICDGDRLLMTKYAGREYTNYALIAGFVEAGETPEDTAHRETLEEAGVKIGNLRYYKSQPWGLTDSLLIGFFADLVGDDTIVLDRNELSEASWIKREDIAVEPNDFSLTNEMICVFKENIKRKASG